MGIVTGALVLKLAAAAMRVFCLAPELMLPRRGVYTSVSTRQLSEEGALTPAPCPRRMNARRTNRPSGLEDTRCWPLSKSRGGIEQISSTDLCSTGFSGEHHPV